MPRRSHVRRYLRELGGRRPADRVALRNMPRRGEPKLEGWFNRLVDGRVEVYLKASNVNGVPDTKIRASGSEESINQVTDWFEETTGLRVSAPWRVRKTKVIEGQTALDVGTVELSSHDATVPADG